MITPPAVEALFAEWLRQHARSVPTDGDLAAFVAALPTGTQRRAARLYARGFVRGCDFCTPMERQRVADDLQAVEARLTALAAFVRALREPPPESTT